MKPRKMNEGEVVEIMMSKNIEKNLKIITLITVLCLPLITTVLGQPQRPQIPEIPDMPQGAQILNMTDLIPVQYRHTFENGAPQILSFQNLRLEVNSSRNLELETTVGSEVAMHYFTLNLEPSEALELVINIDVNPPVEIPKPIKGIEFFLSIEPNTTDPVDSTLKLYIDEETVEAEIGRDIRPVDLSWAFWNGSAWETVRSWLDEEGYLVVDTDHFSTWTIRETGRPIQAPDIPGVPRGAEAHNYSDILPRAFNWRIRDREPTVLIFRNVTMMFNSTKDLDLNITIGSQVVGHIFRLDLIPDESLSLDVNMEVNPPSGVMRMEKDIGIYVEIEPNATVTTDANLSLLIDEADIEAQMGRDIDVSQLTWAHWKGDEWIPVESVIDENGYLNANTSHFSTWTVAEIPEVPVPSPVAPPDIPGIPKDATAYNHSEITPRDFAWTVEAKNATVLSFKNFMLMVNPSKSLDLEISVGSDVAKHLFSLSLVPGESLSLEIGVTVSPPSGVERAQNDIDIYIEIEPNSTASVDATLSLHIDEAAIEAEINRDIDISRLTWAYWDGEKWVTVESFLDGNGYLKAQTSHFSMWTITETTPPEPTLESSQEPEPSPELSPESQPTPSWMSYGGAIAVAGIAVIVIVSVLRRRS